MGCSVCKLKNTSFVQPYNKESCNDNSSLKQFFSKPFGIQYSSLSSEFIDLEHFDVIIDLASIPGSLSRQKGQKETQDACFWVQKTDFLLFCIFDGHGQYGSEVVQLIETFIRSYEAEMQEPQEYLTYLTNQIDRALQDSYIDIQLSGSTQTIGLLYKLNLYVANLGDSQALILSKTKSINKRNINYILQSEFLTKIHNPKNKIERQRIIQNGGVVRSRKDSKDNLDYALRIWNQQGDSPGLAMTRSLGDSQARLIGCICEPTLKQLALNSSHRFIVLASDGVWDALSKKKIEQLLGNAGNYPANNNLAQLVCLQARDLWQTGGGRIDDISAIVVRFMWQDKK